MPSNITMLLATQQGSAVSSEGLAMWLIVLAVLAVLPFVLTMITSFAKIVIVLGIVRQALGMPQIPPTTVITGLALVLTVHVMWPVAETGWSEYKHLSAERSPGNNLEDQVGVILDSALSPMVEFLQRHSHPGNIDLFEALRDASRQSEKPEAGSEPADETDTDTAGADADSGGDNTTDNAAIEGTAQDNEASDLPAIDPEIAASAIRAATVLAPAFILTEITEAFQIGFVIFIPFLVLDLVVSNILLAMGMHMMAPTTVSLPLKLLLFVLVDGWQLILQGLVMGYATGGYA